MNGNYKKIYVENLRSFLDVTKEQAQAILESAVSAGFMQKGVDLFCEEGGVIYSTDMPEMFPKTLECHHSEDGHFKIHLHGPSALKQIVFYFVPGKTGN